ncbi:hypothetical protein D3C77_777680 [compost metagenome]
MLINLIDRVQLAILGNIARRSIDMHMHGEQTTLDQIRLLWLTQTDRAVSMTHGEIQLFIIKNELKLHIRV